MLLLKNVAKIIFLLDRIDENFEDDIEEENIGEEEEEQDEVSGIMQQSDKLTTMIWPINLKESGITKTCLQQTDLVTTILFPSKTRAFEIFLRG